MDTSSASSDRNRHVDEFLRYYIGFGHSPHYAVLLDGPWGIGKTFLLRRFLDAYVDSAAGKPLRYLYVSLYGLRSLEDLDSALLSATYPLLEKKAVKIAGRVASAALKHFRLDAKIGASDFIKASKDLVYVFDDLERCEIPINVALGYINELVEHEGCKVIIVANEKAITDTAYRLRREKLIGKTLVVQSSFEDALTHFLSMVDDAAAHAFLTNNTETIGDVFRQAETHNLRTLQQTLWDFERVYAALSQEHRRNPYAMETLLRLFFALSFEIKSGHLSEDDLLERRMKLLKWAISHDEEKQDRDDPLSKAAARYSRDLLSESLLEDSVLSDILIRGLIDQDEIRASLDRSSYFKAVSEPVWRTLWHFTERTNAQVEAALKTFEEEFRIRSQTISGAMLHVFGIRLWLSDIGAICRTRSEVVSDCKEYIDDLFEQKRLEPRDPEFYEDHFNYSGFDGLGMMEHDTADYRELYTYLRDKRHAAARQTLEARGISLLTELAEDTGQYFRRLCGGDVKGDRCDRTPVLAAIKPSDFVDVVMKLHPANQRTAMMAFKGRYEHGQLRDVLSAERPWLESVRDKLRTVADGLPPLQKFRLTKFIEWYVDAPLILSASN